MKNKVKVKKYKINWQDKRCEVLVPYIERNSLWVGGLETEDGNGILGTWEGLNALSVAFELASRNPYAFIYLPIRDFLIPDVDSVIQQIKYGKTGLLDIVITSTGTQLKRSDWKEIRKKLKHASFESISISYHFDLFDKVESYQIDQMVNGALNDNLAGTFFIVYPQEYLKLTSSNIHDWLNEIKKDKNYTLEYMEEYNDFIFHDFFTDVWNFSFPKHNYKDNKLMCGFYLDCWDTNVMKKFFKRPIKMLTWNEMKEKLELYKR